MLEAVELTKKYGDMTALDRLTLRIEPGEIFCLLGANGAGKSTTINLFLNFTSPTSGRAVVNGLDVTTSAIESKRSLAYIPETVMLYRNLTGLENLAYFSELAGHGYDDGQLRQFLARSGLQIDAVDQRVKGYSKGMRQKVGIAIALAKKATALLLDEPTSGLDPKASNEFALLVRELANDGAAVLMATHDLFQTRELSSRFGIMKRGRLVETRATREIGHAELERIYLEHMHD